MKTIPLSKGYVTIVDDDDFEWLSKHKWYVVSGGGGNIKYAMRGIRHGEYVSYVRMHRAILGTPEGMYTDHINRNGLDNRKANLRVCTHHQNQGNRAPITGRKLKGIHKLKNGRFRATCCQKHLGTYPTAELAAAAYNKAAIEIFGEFARLNPC